MTEGNCMKLIVQFFLPILAGNFFQQFYNFIDSVIVGKGIGDAALAAVGNTGSVHFFILGFMIGLTGGLGIYISQSFGAQDYGKMRQETAMSVLICLGIGVVVTILSLLAMRPLFTFLNTPQDMMKDTISYFRIILIGSTVTVCNNFAMTLLRCVGNSRVPLIAMILSSIINVILDVLFVFPGKMGVSGAALATVLAQVIVTMIMLFGVILQKKENVLKGLRLFVKIPLEYVQGICKIGIPTALQGMVYCFISMVLTRMVAGFGPEAIATQRVGGQIESISWNTADGFGAAMNAFIGQNYGAGKTERVKKGYRASLCTVGIWGILITLVFVVVPVPIASVFFHEKTAIATAVDYLIIVGYSEAFLCVELMTVGALSGLGRTRLCSVISIVFTSLRIPLAIILSSGVLGILGIWWALTTTTMMKGIIFTCAFFIIMRKMTDAQRTDII